MKIIHNLEGKYAMPTHHPVTCANPAPWLITEIKIEGSNGMVWIRNEKSMWFRLDQCCVDTEEALLYLKESFPSSF